MVDFNSGYQLTIDGRAAPTTRTFDAYNPATRAVIEASGAAVVCLTAEATADEREEILRAGAVELVEKGGTVDGLADTIRRAVGSGAAGA